MLALLSEDGDKGKRTQQRQREVYGRCLHVLRSASLPATRGRKACVHYCCVPELVQAKADRCAFYRARLLEALRRTGNRLTLVFYTDECTPGNVLDVANRRKTNLTYVSFLQLPLYMESCWLTVSASRRDEIRQLAGGMPALVRLLLEKIREDSVDGFPVQLNDSVELIFIDRVMVLADHEGLRALTGCKGSSGLKPCLKCSNVLSVRCRSVPGHVRLSEKDASKFRSQTQRGVRDIATHLSGIEGKTALADAEKYLGWVSEGLQCSFLVSDVLQGWCELQDCTFDAMHCLWGNGLVCQEIGLWMAAAGAQHSGVLPCLQQYATRGWKLSPQFGKHQYVMKDLFTDALFVSGSDYKGDAQDALVALPLCVQFSYDLLFEDLALRPAIRSLDALYQVCLCVLRSKIQPEESAALLTLQAEHARCFQLAYPSAFCRPKMHFSLHLRSQCLMWGRLVDCFVCERKHRAFKTHVAPHHNNLARLSKDCLLQLVDLELRSPMPENALEPQLRGAESARPDLAERFAVREAVFAAGASSRGRHTAKGEVLILSPSTAVEVTGAVRVDAGIMLLVERLDSADLNLNAAGHGRSRWLRRRGDSVCALPLADAQLVQRAALVREEALRGAQHLWVLL